jgi:hypothetical protein
MLVQTMMQMMGDGDVCDKSMLFKITFVTIGMA